MEFTTAQTVTIDEENHGDEFWDANGNSNAAWAAYADNIEPGERRDLTAQQATEFLAYCETVPGWIGGPEYAPHPLIFDAA